MTAPRVYYIVQSEMRDGGVIEAQVVARLRAQARWREEAAPRLVFLEPTRIAFGAEARKAREIYKRMWPGGDIAVVPFVSRAGASSAGEALALYLTRERFSSSPLIFHCRGGNATWSAHVARRRLGRGRVVFDLRGADAYETIHRHGFPWLRDLSEAAGRAYERALAAERQAAGVADFVLTVSEGLREYAMNVLGAQPDSIAVTPSCVDDLTFDDERREAVRRRWRVPVDSPVFLYAGRLGPERLPRHMFRVFATALAQRPNARLVLLTYRDDLESTDALTREAGVPPSSIIRDSCSRDDVMAQLCAADVGFFFCEAALRFRYCFPIKLPEYLSAGLSIVLNSAAAEVPDLVRARRVGWVIDEDLSDAAVADGVREMLEALASDRQDLRQRSLQCCSELFLWRNQLSSLDRAYGAVAGVAPAAGLAER